MLLTRQLIEPRRSVSYNCTAGANVNEPVLLTEVLRVDRADTSEGNDVFVGPSMPTLHGRAYGGQVMAQALMAASATVEPDRVAHSLHCYFVRPGLSDEPMTLSVGRALDGRSFSSRTVKVMQQGEVIMSFMASYQVPQAGLEHQLSLDLSSFGEPEELVNLREKYATTDPTSRSSWITLRPFDVRYVQGDIFVENSGPSSTQAVWLRASEPLPDDPNFARAALAFGSDYTLVEAVVRAHGLSWSEPRLKVASLDHVMWFHRDFSANEWLLYLHEASTSQHSRGLTLGKFFNRSGELIATVGQEAMIRLAD